MPYAASRDGACSPPPGGVTSPREASPGIAPHLYSAGVASMLNFEDLPPAATTPRSLSPQQASGRVRSLILHENLDHRPDVSPEPPHTGRRRVSPPRVKESAPQGKGRSIPPLATQGSRMESAGSPAGRPSARSNAVAAVDGRGWGCMAALKELEYEGDRLQLRPGLSPRSPRSVFPPEYVDTVDDLVAHPHLTDLPLTELRSMGRNLIEANTRLRDQMAQASKAQRQTSSQSSLKRVKATSALSPRALSPRERACSPTASKGIARQLSPRPCSPFGRAGAAPAKAERASTMPRRPREGQTHAPTPGSQEALLNLRAEVATLMDEVPKAHASAVHALGAAAAPNFGREQQAAATHAVEVPEIRRMPTAPASYWQRPASPLHNASTVALAAAVAAATRVAPLPSNIAEVKPAGTSRSQALTSDVSFAKLGEGVFTWQPPDSRRASCVAFAPKERSEGVVDTVCDAAAASRNQVAAVVSSEVVLTHPAAVPTAPPVTGSQSCADHLERIKMRCDQLMQKANKAHEVSVSPKKRTSFGGA